MAYYSIKRVWFGILLLIAALWFVAGVFVIDRSVTATTRNIAGMEEIPEPLRALKFDGDVKYVVVRRIHWHEVFLEGRIQADSLKDFRMAHKIDMSLIDDSIPQSVASQLGDISQNWPSGREFHCFVGERNTLGFIWIYYRPETGRLIIRDKTE